ncbi:hypothetical protein, partial [Kocuria marina]
MSGALSAQLEELVAGFTAVPQEDNLELLLDLSPSLPALSDRLGERPEE